MIKFIADNWLIIGFVLGFFGWMINKAIQEISNQNKIESDFSEIYRKVKNGEKIDE